MRWSNKYTLRYFLLIQLVLISPIVLSQQLPKYSMLELVRPGVNPAYTGLEGIYDMVLLTRQQSQLWSISFRLPADLAGCLLLP